MIFKILFEDADGSIVINPSEKDFILYLPEKMQKIELRIIGKDGTRYSLAQVYAYSMQNPTTWNDTWVRIASAGIFTLHTRGQPQNPVVMNFFEFGFYFGLMLERFRNKKNVTVEFGQTRVTPEEIDRVMGNMPDA